MHGRWWQSIRWRLVLGSVLLALLTTSLLALTAIFVTTYYYGADQQSRLSNFANDKIQNIGSTYIQNKHNLYDASKMAINNPNNKHDQLQQPTAIILKNNTLVPVYPNLGSILLRKGLNTQKTKIQDTAALEHTILESIYPPEQKEDLLLFSQAISQAQKGNDVDGRFGRNSPVHAAQAFTVRPIFMGGEKDNTNTPIIGIFVATTRPDVVPAFVSDVGIAVSIASLLIAMLAAVIAIIFSQTITRPLGRLTKASRVLASGNYNARVSTQAPGELGELAQTFNEMAEQLKKDVEELRQQEMWRSELIMNITHDLATPLTAIAGLGEALVDGINQSREDYEATGSIIVRETLRLHRLVQDLHVMAKVEAGALQPKKKLLRLAALVDEVFAALATEFERHQIEPNNAVDFNLPVTQVDSDMFTRVFSNLFTNALRHTPAGGKITVDAQQQGNMLHVSVTDTGEGIPEKALARVFERFYRADSSRQSSKGGSGLGLAIVRAIVEAHGGTVWAESAPGKTGARICFTLPIAAHENFPIHDIPTMPIVSKNIHPVRLTRMNK